MKKSIKNLFNQLHNEFYKDRRKRAIIFVHSLNFNNTGDSNCAPYKYFLDYWADKHCNIMDLDSPLINEIKEDDVVIVGGGGLIDFGEQWNKCLNTILDRSRYVIGWGLGFNTHYDTNKPANAVNFEKFKLLGNRDEGSGLPYLPCVSCMNSLLDRQYDIKRKIGIVEHQHFPIPLDYERVNNSASLEQMIEFIGSSEKIITNGYHAMYWATLMKKRVVLYKPFSSRYDRFRYRPVIYSGNIQADLEKTVIYTNALTECRILNRQFFQQVKQILES